MTADALYKSTKNVDFPPATSMRTDLDVCPIQWICPHQWPPPQDYLTRGRRCNKTRQTALAWIDLFDQMLAPTNHLVAALRKCRARPPLAESIVNIDVSQMQHVVSKSLARRMH